MPFVSWSLILVLVIPMLAAWVLIFLPPLRSPRFAFVQRHLPVAVPVLALLFVWGLAVGTRFATGEWPVPCRMLFPMSATEPEIVYVGSPSYAAVGRWLQFPGQLLLVTTLALAIPIPILMTVRALRLWRRNLLILLCAALIVASYATTPGRNAIDWIID